MLLLQFAYELQLAGLVLGPDADDFGGVVGGVNWLAMSDTSHCGKMAALEQLLSVWHSQQDKVGARWDTYLCVYLLHQHTLFCYFGLWMMMMGQQKVRG